ncbi:MAG TPA: N,N-dimethylformamidase beta subunit family domain-containing protein [Ktedonosporobacter sp.]|nr:N,N-dimethylformamidase beta subunit family domain-containing protein [Ktedonosporobacter sp.]
MKRRSAIGIIVSGVSGAGLLAAKFVPDYMKGLFGGQQSGKTQASAASSAPNPITLENALPGTTEWMIPAERSATVQIQAYAGARSVAPGQPLTFYVSTQEAGTPYAITIYRLGWYQGAGGRLVTSIKNLVGQAQGYFNEVTFELIKSPSAHTDPATHLVEARWQPSHTLTIPADWTTGVYLAKFTDAHGMQTYTSFTVRGNPTAPYVLVTPDTTYAAYNNWGGHSLYASNSKEQVPAAKVSFDRPSTQNQGSDQVLSYQANAIRWFERQGYDLTYLSNIDMHANGALLLRHQAYISLGHDEYWTMGMRNAVENARDQGKGLAFLEANAAYWQVRLEPNSAGVANRSVVCYKVLTAQDDLHRDPLYNVNNQLVTTQWRDALLGRPENAMIGVMYSNYNNNQQGSAWHVAPQVQTALFKGTGLAAGQQYNYGLVGHEWDKVFDNGHTPSTLKILGSSPTVSIDGKTDLSHTTYYVAPSGSMVFATGSIFWTSALDSYRYSISPWKNEAQAVPEIQNLMGNVMDALITHH